jgi:fermentation-respiration switch protein FrsA (DUF1100 family)
MIARTLHCVSEASLTALALFDLRRACREGLLSRICRPPEVRSAIVPVRQSELRADLYLPGREGKHGGLVMVPGFTEFGKDDARVVWLARHLARIGFVVLVPDLPGLRSWRAREADVGDMVDSFRYLATCSPGLRPDRLGLMGFSYGAGPTVIAAADSAIADQVRFVISFGGYFDLVDVIRFVTTGHFAWEGHRGHIPSSPHARGRFLLANLDLVQEAQDQEILVAVAKGLADGEWRPTVRTDRLSPWGAALYALLMNTDPERVDALIERLDPRIRERIACLSPSRVIERLQAHLVIIHGLEDDYIPYSESLRLAAAAPRKGHVHLALTRLISHVDVVGPDLRPAGSRRAYLRELWQVARVIRFLVAQRC